MRVQNEEYKDLHQKYNFNIEQWFISIKIGKIQFLGEIFLLSLSLSVWHRINIRNLEHGVQYFIIQFSTYLFIYTDPICISGSRFKFFVKPTKFVRYCELTI